MFHYLINFSVVTFICYAAAYPAGAILRRRRCVRPRRKRGAALRVIYGKQTARRSLHAA